MKVLVLGGTGCMGAYLCPKLVSCGFEVDAVTLEKDAEKTAGVSYIVENAMNETALKKILQKGYDAIVDFMWYDSKQFFERADLLLKSAKHYISLSSYRVYADSMNALNECSPRLLDTVADGVFQASDDYAQAKCRIENFLARSSYGNWTIVRPVVVYGGERLPMIATPVAALEQAIGRGERVKLPIAAMDKTAAIVWAGDAAEMIARLVLQPFAYRETFLLGSSEQVTWREIADYYSELTGMAWEEVETDAFLGTDAYARPSAWIYLYDRFYDRKIDNRKILAATGMEQAALKTPRQALEYEWNNRIRKNRRT